MTDQPAASRGPGPDTGVAPNDLEDGKLLGHVGEHDVLLVRSGRRFSPWARSARIITARWPKVSLSARPFAVPGTMRVLTCAPARPCALRRCSRYRAGPSRDPITKFSCGRGALSQSQAPSRKANSPDPDKIVIIGGGAAAFAAAEMLRREQYKNSIVMLSEDAAPPIDRPNLSKDYLAGNGIGGLAAATAGCVLCRERHRSPPRDTRRAHRSRFARGCDRLMARQSPYDRLLLATGAEPNVLSIPGADLPHVRTLRSLADSRAIIEAAKTARKAVVVGAGFIGLEVAASLRSRNIEVHVVAPDKRPMERILGPQMADFLRSLHEEHGVVFHLEDIPVRIDADRVTTRGGAVIEADLVIVGIGVHPRTRLAEDAGLTVERGVVVDAYLETSTKGIFAAGDIARWPDRRSGERIRVEHWVVAERMGQTAALNMLGHNVEFDAVPFFWSQHYDVPINYVGHAERWDALEIEGEHLPQGLPFALQTSWPSSRRSLHIPRHRMPQGRVGDGGRCGKRKFGSHRPVKSRCIRGVVL